MIYTMGLTFDLVCNVKKEEATPYSISKYTLVIGFAHRIFFWGRILLMG